MHKDFFVLDCIFVLALLFGLRIIPKTQSNLNTNGGRVKYFTYLRSVHFIQHHNGGAVVVEH